MNQNIRRTIYATLANSKRALNSRTLAGIMSRKFQVPIQKIYGNLSLMTKMNTIVWVSRKNGGPSYLKV